MTAYAVAIQPSAGFEFKNEVFTVVVAATGFDSAARRGVRRAVARAEEWNAQNPEALTPRLTSRNAYRALAVRSLVGFNVVTGADGALLDVNAALAELEKSADD